MAREIRTVGRPIEVELEVYDTCKYRADAETFKNRKIVHYTDVTEWVIVTGKDAEEIEAHTDGSCIDDLHEYLEIHFGDGDIATFRNSYCEMFRTR